MAATNNRPLSPHLSIWRWGPGMTVSILHRITGAGLSILGLALLTWWLMALSGGPETYNPFLETLWAKPAGIPIGLIFMIGLTWAFLQHLLSGVRHLVMDSGAGFELGTNKRYAILTIVGSVALTALIWAYLLGAIK